MRERERDGEREREREREAEDMVKALSSDFMILCSVILKSANITVNFNYSSVKIFGFCLCYMN